MLCIKVMDGLQALRTTCVHMWEYVCQNTGLIFATVELAHEDARRREKMGFWYFHRVCGISVMALLAGWTAGSRI